MDFAGAFQNLADSLSKPHDAMGTVPNGDQILNGQAPALDVGATQQAPGSYSRGLSNALSKGQQLGKELQQDMNVQTQGAIVPGAVSSMQQGPQWQQYQQY